MAWRRIHSRTGTICLRRFGVQSRGAVPLPCCDQTEEEQARSRRRRREGEERKEQRQQHRCQQQRQQAEAHRGSGCCSKEGNVKASLSFALISQKCHTHNICFNSSPVRLGTLLARFLIRDRWLGSFLFSRVSFIFFLSKARLDFLRYSCRDRGRRTSRERERERDKRHGGKETRERGERKGKEEGTLEERKSRAEQKEE